MSVEQLSRRALIAHGIDAKPAPVRIVHLGLGAFHRAHQAFYTMHASDGAEWGIASFTGRSPDQAELLTAQDGVYSLVERGLVGDSLEVVTSIVEAVDGRNLDRLSELVADPAVAIVTLTITEAGYRITSDGRVDRQDAVVRSDLAALRAAWPQGRLALAAPEGALTRLLVGLDARRRAGGGPIAVVSCDNLPDNGLITRQAVIELAAEVDDALAQWVKSSVSFVSTSVDRITPRSAGTPAAVAEAGWRDHAAIVTEPFRDWVLSGDFPAGRPAWESAGARFVDEIEPWEQRKLWLLNGAHSILTYRGILAGHETVAEAMNDPECRAQVDAFWAEAAALLAPELDAAEYCRALVERFENERIVHKLDQIAAESTVKVRVRFVAVAERTREAGGDAAASVDAIAGWMSWALAGHTAPDSRVADLEEALLASDPVGALLRLVSPSLASDDTVVAYLRNAVTLSSAPSLVSPKN